MDQLESFSIWTTLTTLFNLTLVKLLLLWLNYNGTFYVGIIWKLPCNNPHQNTKWQLLEPMKTFELQSTICLSVHKSFSPRGILLLTIHTLAWMLCEIRSCWEQWVQALLPSVLTLFQANEAQSSGEPGQSRLKSDLHVCSDKQIGINAEFNILNIFHIGATGKKVLQTFIFLPGKPLQSREWKDYYNISTHGQKTSCSVYDTVWWNLKKLLIKSSSGNIFDTNTEANDAL